MKEGKATDIDVILAELLKNLDDDIHNLLYEITTTGKTVLLRSGFGRL